MRAPAERQITTERGYRGLSPTVEPRRSGGGRSDTVHPGADEEYGGPQPRPEESGHAGERRSRGRGSYTSLSG